MIVAGRDRAVSREQVWKALLHHKQRALRVARARAGRAEDAEDLVQEAFVRIAAMPQVDVDRVGSLVSTVVANLAVDEHRRRMRSRRTLARMHDSEVEVARDDEVCDAHEARWLWSLRGQLAPQDRRVLELRARGLSLREVAAELGITYKGAENALGRARAKMRAAWRATLGGCGVFWEHKLLRDPHTASAAVPAVVLAAAAVAVAIGITAPPGGPSSPRGQRPAATGPAPSLVSPQPVPAPPRAHSMPSPSPVRQSEGRSLLPAGGRRLATRPVDTPILRVEPAGIEEHRGDESFLDSAKRCVEEGVSLRLEALGCPPDQGPGTHTLVPFHTR
jgi:RNA polymerase sigma-70 factor (ECF subfamily)